MFQQLIDENVDAILVLQASSAEHLGEIRYANPAAGRLLGHSACELVGRPFGHPITQEGTCAELAICRIDPEGHQALRSVEMCSGPILWEGEPAVLATLRDVTERRHAESSVHFLAEAARQLAESLDERTILQTATRLARKHFGQVAMVHLLNNEGHLDLAISDPPWEEPCRILETNLQPLFNLNEVRSGELPTQDENHPLVHYMRGALSTGGQTIGMLTVLLRPGSPAPTPCQLSVIETVARRAATALENARLYRISELENQRKTEFLAMLGHELRNPLSAIATALQVHKLCFLSSDSSQHEPLHVIERQLGHITRLVDELLEMSRIKCGRIELKAYRFDLSEFVLQRAGSCTSLIHDRGHQLSIQVPPESVWVEADADRLEQVMANLLHNAAKFSDVNGPIKVELTATETEAHLVIRDQGVGIAPELLPELFQPFRSGPQSLDRSHGGLGIGLALVRGLVELHHGHVQARSEGIGRGSEFVITLPRVIEVPPPPCIPTVPACSNSSSFATGTRVLLVEDNRDSREMLQQLLGSLGYDVVVAADGVSGLALALQTDPKAAVIDIGLPGLDGYQLARRFREEEARQLRSEGQRTLLIALTGYGLPSDVADAYEAGFDLHLVKPLDVSRLLGLLGVLNG